MRLNSVSERTKYGKTTTLYPLGDMHLGSANCDKRLLFDTIAEVRNDPDARWIGLGDYCEYITPSDKRWHAGGLDFAWVDPGAIDRIIDVHVEKLADLLAPIMDKCWGMGDGNHERKSNGLYYTNAVVRALERLGRPELYTGWDAITRVEFSCEKTSRVPLKIYHMHGYQAGRKDGAKVNGLDDLMGYIDGCRIYLVGHSHSRLIKCKTKLSANQAFTDLRAEDCYGAHCGSFLRTYQLDQNAYGEVAGYPPTSMGPVQFKITPRRKSTVTAGVRETKSWLEIKAVQ